METPSRWPRPSPGALKASRGHALFRAAWSSTCKGADRLVPRIVEAAEAEGFALADLSVAEPTLETVFIGLTGKDLRD